MTCTLTRSCPVLCVQCYFDAVEPLFSGHRLRKITFCLYQDVMFVYYETVSLYL